MRYKRFFTDQPAIDPELISSNLIETNCIAEDEHYGTYKGIILGGCRRCSEVRVVVRIDECVKPPNEKAILNRNACFHREAYRPGSIQVFTLDKVHSLVIETA